MKYTAVITTINPPGKAIEEITKRIPAIVIGDEKTPKDWKHDKVTYDDGNGLNWTYKPPVNHYARKNLGYLLAMQGGADCIYDTDDDNIPNENWKLRDLMCKAKPVTNKGWCNVYDAFTPYFIWPRGLPLTEIRRRRTIRLEEDSKLVTSPIQQGLSNGSPDVDAIWRLTGGEEFQFPFEGSVYLPKGTWSPFNSQSTWWFKEAFPLLYLPQYATFRMCDIWRSFVAQRCLWEMGRGVVFHSPAEVTQERNPHDLMQDFRDEIPGYLNNDRIRVALDELELGTDLLKNMSLCYTELTLIGVLPTDELRSLRQWRAGIEKVWKP
jgi:hypothetical protein